MKSTKELTQTIKEQTRRKDGYEYHYSLTKRQSRAVSSFSLPLYSIKITMRGEDAYTENEAKDIFSDIGKALTFFGTLVENLATPIDLPYILEDGI